MHHANIIISRGDCKSFVFDILRKDLNFNISANPDFLMIENESFGIDDARNLEKWAILKPFLSETKVSFVIAKSITFEAQNALLKVLEEPTPGTYFFINLENEGGLLPTFLSRVSILELPKPAKGVSKGHPLGQNSSRVTLGEKTPFAGEAQKFLHSDIKGKFSLIQSLSKKTDKTDMKELIKDLEEVAYKEKVPANQMKNILKAKIFSTARGASPKMLLEWLACVV